MGFIGSAVNSIFGGGNNAQFQAAAPTLTDQDFLSAINATRSNPNFVDFGQSNAVNGQQNDLSQALIDQANGKGPSQTQNFLRQATDQGIQNQAGLIGSQKGLSPALAARLILQNGANQNQQAAGQGATLAMQEQIDARKQLADVLNAQRGSDINQAVQGTQAKTQYEQMLQNALAQQNATKAGVTANQNSTNASVANNNANNDKGLLGGIASSVSGALPGVVSGVGKLFGGGATSAVGNVAGGGEAIGDLAGLALVNKGGKIAGQPQIHGDSPANDTVPAMLSPGEIVIPRTSAGSVKKAKEFIDHIMSEKDVSQPKGYSKVLKLHKAMDDRISQLEKLCYGGMSGK